MGDSDVDRRGVKEWLTRSVQSFLRWPKWKPVGEWLQRRLSSLFHPTPPKFLAYFIILVAAGWILWIWLGKPPFSFYSWNGNGNPPLGSILSTLIVVLATVTALVLSIMFITVQLSANTYTPRVIRVHFYALHFLGIVTFFLGTIGYLAWRLGQAQNWGAGRCPWTETSFILFFACLLLLIPYIWISIRLLQPKHLFERLMWSISANDFHRAAEGKPNKLDEKLQPVIDIIRRIPTGGQLRTVKDAFEALSKHLGKMIRFSKEKLLSNRIAVTIDDKYSGIKQFFTSSTVFCELPATAIQGLTKFIEAYRASRFPQFALLMFDLLDKFKKEFLEKCNREIWYLEYERVMTLYAEAPRLIVDILQSERSKTNG